MKTARTTAGAMMAAFRVTSYPIVCDPNNNGQPYQVDLSKLVTEHNNEYCLNNGTVCFVLDGEIYAAPFTRKLFSGIRKTGLREGVFYVPFSNGDVPYHDRGHWEELRAKAWKSQLEDFEEDAKAWCRDNGIRELDKKFLAHSLRIPRSGIPVEDCGVKGVYYPRLSEASFDCVAMDKIATYSYNAGRVAFVYNDGHTYLSKDTSIMDALDKAGYKRQDFLVPLSGPEKITDNYLRHLWDSIPEVTR